MQFLTDPKSGKELSVLGFGCMRFPIDKEKAEQLVVTAVNAGMNYFDTAYIYGNSEVTLGAIVDKNKLREKIYIATKLPHSKCKNYGDFDRFFNEQLTRLKTDYIDYYLIHNLGDMAAWGRVCDLGIEKWIAEKKESGQIRQIGFSFHGAQNSFFELLDAYDWDFTQIQYNYMDENYQAGRVGLEQAHKRGLPVIIMEPLLGGKLATGLPQKAQKLFRDADDSRTPASWALAWLWNQPGVTVVLSGMNNMAQLEENLKTAQTAKPGMLSEKEEAVFHPVMDSIRESYKVVCTGCNYCMPCPHGVNIPGCFSSYNTRYAMGLIPGMTQYITSTGATHADKTARAKFCVGCKACEKKCPQHIQIANELQNVTKYMESSLFKIGIKLIQKFM